MIKRLVFTLIGLATLLASSVYANSSGEMWSSGDGPSAPWFSGQEVNIENIKIIKACLKDSADKKSCQELQLAHKGPNWGSAAAQHAHEWSVIGQQYIEKMTEQYPSEAKTIKADQLAWYASAKKQCELERDSATYEDDDAEGNHPEFYDWVTYISCVYGQTMDRVLLLRSQTSE